MTDTIPQPDGKLALAALKAIRREGTSLAAIQVFHQQLGDIFRLSLPGLNMLMLVGPEANRMLLVSEYENVRWRTESDPIARLLGQGLLVSDGPVHDDARKAMTPSVHKRALAGYVECMSRRTDQIAATWDGKPSVDMLEEMRRVTILITMETLFSVDWETEMEELWEPILAMIRYISPGLWLFWPNMPRPQFREPFRRIDESIYGLIRRRRALRESGSYDGEESLDLLDMMIEAEMDDKLIRDQILTMFIAGHDTSTGMLAWALYFLATDPVAFERARAEVDSVLGDDPPRMDQLGDLRFVGHILDESMRLYPPAHAGARVALTDLAFQGHTIATGERMLYSIYLSHRDPNEWENPDQFMPQRFEVPAGQRAFTPYAFLPFGGGLRNCMGAAYGQVEGKVVLARILQKYDLRYVGGKITPTMKVTIEPRPGVFVEVTKRASG